MPTPDIGRLLELHKLGRLTIDQKVAILEHYGITFPMREIARALTDILEEKVRGARRTNYDATLEAATEADVQAAVAKVLDKYVMEAEAQYIVALTERLVHEDLVLRYGAKIGNRKARRQKYRWVSVTEDKLTCPQCIERHGREETMAVWRELGVPRAGATYCKQWCRCRLLPIDEPMEIGKGIIPEAIGGL